MINIFLLFYSAIVTLFSSYPFEELKIILKIPKSQLYIWKLLVSIADYDVVCLHTDY